MNELESPLPERVLYTENQRLVADDFSDEQAYLAGAERLHRITQHRWGIVRGLVLAPAGEGVRLSRGVAVDKYGRQLQVPEAVELTPAEVAVVPRRLLGDEPGEVELDLWLLYDSELASSPGHTGEPDRVREFAVLRFTLADGVVDPDDPPFTEPPPPGSSLPVWPVYLGRIGWPSIEVLGVERRYAPQVGGAMAATDGSVELTLLDEARPTRREVRVLTTGAGGGTVARLQVDDTPSVTVRGPLTVDGDLCLEPAETAALAWALPASLPAGPVPWRAYRVHLAPQGGGNEEEDEEPGATVDEEVSELRFELDPFLSEKRPSERGLSFGFREASEDEESETYRGVLTVTSAGKVVVAGNLVVDGTLTEPPIVPDPRDPRFLAAMNEEWYAGLEAGVVRAAPTLGLSIAKEAPPVVHAGRETLFGYFAANTGTATMTVEIYDCGEDPGCGGKKLIGRKTLDPGQVAAVYQCEEVPSGVEEWTTYMCATGVAGPELETKAEASVTVTPVADDLKESAC